MSAARPDGGFRAGWPIRQVAAGQLASLARLAAFLATGSSVVASLVLMLPVAAYYQTADFTQAGFDLEIDGAITPGVEAALLPLAIPGSATTLIALDPAVLRANGREAAPAKVYISPVPDTIDNSWFRDAETVAGEAATGQQDWIDLSADAARELAVSVGDVVTVPFPGSEVPVKVRRIMAIARFGIRNIGVAPLSPAMRRALANTEGGTTPSVMFLRSDADESAVRAALEPVPGGSKLQVQSRREWIAQTRLDPMLSEPIRLAALVLGLTTLLGLALREGEALFERRRQAFSVLVALGAAPSRVLASALLVESVPVFAAMVLAWVVTRQLAYRTVFAAALPPTFDVPLAISLIATGCAYLIAVALSTSRRLRRHNICLALTTP